MDTTAVELITEITSDQLESELARLESLRNRAAAVQVALIAEADRRQLATSDGCRNLTDWVAWRLDVSHETSRRYIDLARRLNGLPQLQQRLADGELGMERAALLVPVASADTESDLMARLGGHNLTQVARFAAHHKRLGRHRERLDHDQSYVVIQPSLDESWWRLNGGLTGPAGAAVEQALKQRSDQLPSDGTAAAHRQALALESLALDSLDAPLPDGTIPRTPAITAFVDWDLASATGGEAGAEIAAGPRIGPDALEELWCEGSVRVITVADGQPVTATPNTRTIPPAVRHYVLWRDGACRAPGCTSRHRLQPHHVIPRSRGGGHHPDNLLTMCWFHHHIVIHRRGFTLESDEGSIRFVRPQHGRDPP